MPGRARTKLRKQKTATRPSKLRSRKQSPQPHAEFDTSMWTEALFGAEVLLLHATPVYYGFGVPRGNGSGVVIIPGFLGTDLYLTELHGWLGRIGYRPYFSGIGINADCPNILVQRHVSATIKRALDETGRKIHLIGHSLGGVIARSIAGDRPKDIASVITLVSPIRGTVAHRSVIHAADAIRLRILQEHGNGVLPRCYTSADTSASSSAGSDSVPTGPPPIQEPDASKVKHDGKEDDVDAIGNRKIGGRGLGNWYSLETEVRMGKQYAMQVESSVKLVQDPVVTEYVNRIGQNLVRNSDAQVPFTIKVIDSDEVNAFALPGGFFYVNTGLILAADEEAELAGVMAHEISHVCARHGTRQMTRAQWANIGTIPLIFIGGGIGYGIYEAAGLGLPLTFMKFQRNFEAEADYLGLQYMYKTGYDPQAFISFFEKIQAKEKKKPGTIAKAFASHPQTPDRIAASQKEIATILPASTQYIVTTSEFDDVKSRLAIIENRHKVLEEKDGSRPRSEEHTSEL